VLYRALVIMVISERHWIPDSGPGMCCMYHVCPSHFWNAINYLVKITSITKPP
jgi:hypothetical protein